MIMKNIRTYLEADAVGSLDVKCNALQWSLAVVAWLRCPVKHGPHWYPASSHLTGLFIAVASVGYRA